MRLKELLEGTQLKKSSAMTIRLDSEYEYKGLQEFDIVTTPRLQLEDMRFLKTLEKFPNTIEGDLRIMRCKNLESLEGGPMIVVGNVWIGICNELKTLSGVSKRFLKEIHGTFSFPDSIESSILGVLNIRGLTNFSEINSPNTDTIQGEMNFNAMRILQQHFRHGKDVLDCQEEMIQSGLKEYAKL